VLYITVQWFRNRLSLHLLAGQPIRESASDISSSAHLKFDCHLDVAVANELRQLLALLVHVDAQHAVEQVDEALLLHALGSVSNYVNKVKSERKAVFHPFSILVVGVAHLAGACSVDSQAYGCALL